jgi:predicted nucleotidyltransferase
MRSVDLDRVAATFSLWPRVIAAWVFGSARSGLVPPDGDLDIAVLTDAPLSLDELADLRGALQEASRIDQIDLILLEGAGAILRFEAVCGRLLFCRDEQIRAGFASLAAREYEDEMALLAKTLRGVRGT